MRLFPRPCVIADLGRDVQRLLRDGKRVEQIWLAADLWDEARLALHLEPAVTAFAMPVYQYPGTIIDVAVGPMGAP